MLHFGKNPVRVTRAVILTLAIGFVGSNMHGARADDPVALPIVTITGLAPSYLSTATINATVTVTNPTAQTIHFLAADILRDGSEPTLRTISWVPSSIAVSPGQTIRYPQVLPKCVVIEDPCVQRVTASVRFSESPDVVKSAEYRYTILPDPSATFRIDRLSGNRPVLLVNYLDSVPLAFTTPAIELFVPWDPVTRQAPHARATAQSILAAHGLTSASANIGNSKGITDDYDLSPADDSAMIAATIREVHERLGDRVTVRLVFRNPQSPSGGVFSWSPFAGTAYGESARPDTEYKIASYLGIQVDESSSKIADAYSINPGWSSRPETPFVGEDERARFASAPQPRPAIFTVFDRWTQEYMGTRPAFILSPVARPRDERYDFALHAAQAPLIRLVIADDRTQVFAVGFAEAASAASRGVDAQAASIDIAMRRCRELATDLGLGAGPLTLAVAYPRLDQVPGQIAVTGVAMATTGVMPLPALRPTPPPATTQTMPRPPTPATAGPMPMTTYLAATAPPSPNTPPQSAQTAPPDPVPIDVDDVGDTLISSGSGTLSVPADELLLTIHIESNPRLSPGPENRTVLETLRADPRVASAELAILSVYMAEIAEYHVVMRNANPASAWNVVNVARRAAGQRASSRFAYDGALRSCREAGAKVVRQAAHEALTGAAKSASFLGLNVRRLILATVDGPTTDSGRCAPDETVGSGFPDYPSRSASPAPNEAPPTVTFHSAVRLTFRAFRFGT